MAVGFKVKYYWYQIGSGDFLHSFFSTVAYRLENGIWGSVYPIIMNELYQGELPAEKISKVSEKIDLLGLKAYMSEKIIYSVN